MVPVGFAFPHDDHKFPSTSLFTHQYWGRPPNLPESTWYKGKVHPSSRNWTSDLRITVIMNLQSSALPAELSKGKFNIFRAFFHDTYKDTSQPQINYFVFRTMLRLKKSNTKTLETCIWKVLSLPSCNMKRQDIYKSTYDTNVENKNKIPSTTPFTGQCWGQPMNVPMTSTLLFKDSTL